MAAGHVGKATKGEINQWSLVYAAATGVLDAVACVCNWHWRENGNALRL